MKERSSVGQQDNRIKTYVILRCLLILLVVIGHANYYTVYTDYGGFDWTGVMKACAIEDTIAHRTTCLFTGIIYSFHMPMYIALSGALLEYGTKRDLLTTMKNKAKRLLIPFLVVTTVISLPIKYLTGYWAFSSNILRDIIVGQYLMQGDTHLWFLPTLFLETIVFTLIRKKEAEIGRPLSIVLFILGVIGVMTYTYIPVGILSCFAHYFLWFYTGMLFERKRVALEPLMDIKAYGLFLALWLALYELNDFIPGTNEPLKLLRSFISVPVAIFGMICTYAFCNILSKRSVINWRSVNVIEKYSFGIYLYSDLLNYVILNAFVHFFSVKAFGSEGLSFLLFITRVVVTLGVSLAFSIFLRRVLKLKTLS